jgi:hypothetical protein
MVQRLIINYAAVRDAQISLRRVECALGMVQREYAAVEDAIIMLLREEFALGMEQRSSDAALMGARI